MGGYGGPGGCLVHRLLARVCVPSLSCWMQKVWQVLQRGLELGCGNQGEQLNNNSLVAASRPKVVRHATGKTLWRLCSPFR